ncbi:MAG: MerR family transcriptional regulator [Proteobacteria bacterium]|nr:MerR family transcriptional regulator [Pseudomonadota bacterium]
MDTKKYTIDNLVELTGYSRRTIRYYVQEGLIEPPAGRGRGGFYFDSHLNKLLQIKSLQEKGMGLNAIMGYLQGTKEDEEPRPEDKHYQREVWVKYEIVPGIEVTIRRDIEEKEGKKVFELVRVAKSIMKEGKGDE